MICKKICLFLLTITSVLMVGCTNKEETKVTEIPYNPYDFSAREFLEEGGWNAAKEMTDAEMPRILCETLNIVLDPDEQYKQILTVSGDIYDFENAEMKCAVFSKPSIEEIQEGSATYNNRLDVVYEIPVEKNGYVRATAFDVIFTNITRSKDARYNCVSVTGTENLTVYLNCNKGIQSNVDYIENNAEVKEPLDYGLLYCTGIGDEDSPDDVYRKVYNLALELEEERVNNYLIAHSHDSSGFFSMNSNSANYTIDSTSYSTNFDEQKIISDLTFCAENYGLKVYQEPLPTKERKIKKEKWLLYAVPYNAEVENGKEAQEYLKTCIRDMYIENQNYEVAFLVQYDEQSHDACVTFYYRVYQKEK